MHQHRHLPFENLSIMRFKLDHFIHVEIGDDTEIFYEIILVNDFPLTLGGETHVLSPERLSEVGPLLKLFMEQLHSAYYTDDYDTLFIEFMNGATISVDPHPDYEAWNIFSSSEHSPIKLEIYCKPKEKGSV